MPPKTMFSVHLHYSYAVFFIGLVAQLLTPMICQAHPKNSSFYQQESFLLVLLGLILLGLATGLERDRLKRLKELLHIAGHNRFQPITLKQSRAKTYRSRNGQY